MKTERLTMAQALVRFLDNQYINVDGEEIKYVEGILGIFGHGIVVGLGEAIEAQGHSLKFYQGKSEQGMAHVAMGFAKQSKRKRIMAVTSSIGPGALNMVTAAGTATANRIPVLFLPADAYADRQPDPVLQQIEQPYDYNITANDAFKPVSRYWDRISRPEQLMTAAIHAMRVLTDPAETGAVTLCLPQDVQGEAYDYPVEFLEKRVHFIQRRDIDPLVLERVVEQIMASRKPFIVCGGGVRYSDAGNELAAFANNFRIPFGETQAAKGTILSAHPMNMGGAGVTGTMASNDLAMDADLIIGIGTRLNDFCTASKSAYQSQDLQMVSINVNSLDAYKMNSLPVFADAKLALNALQRELTLRGYQSGYKQEIAAAKADWDKEVDRLYGLEEKDGIPQTRILGELNESLIPNDAIIITASGSLPSDLQRVWRCRDKDGYHAEYAFSCMGYEVNAALGVKLAEPNREVYAILGDGSFVMSHSEILTSIQEQIKISVILLDNSGFQCIHNLQRSQGIPSFANEFRFREKETDRLTGPCVPVDFATIAEGYGAAGYRADTVDKFIKAFEEMRAQPKTALLDVKVLPGTMTEGYNSWWRVGTAEVSQHHNVEKSSKKQADEVKKARKF